MSSIAIDLFRDADMIQMEVKSTCEVIQFSTISNSKHVDNQVKSVKSVKPRNQISRNQNFEKYIIQKSKSKNQKLKDEMIKGYMKLLSDYECQTQQK